MREQRFTTREVPLAAPSGRTLRLVTALPVRFRERVETPVLRLTLVVACLATTACSTQSSGGAGGGGIGGGSGGDGQGVGGSPGGTTEQAATASSTSSGSPDVPCGTEGGLPCAGGSLCDPSSPTACHDAGQFHCQRYDRSTCAELTRPTCEAGWLGTCNPGPEVACGCSGTVASVPCLAYIGIAEDPAHCSQGTFTCGLEQCREHLDVCVQSVAEGADGTCVPADSMGCAQYGIAWCPCLQIEFSQECVIPGPSSAVRVVNRRAGATGEIGQ